jgi:hypothetical protein
MPCKQATGLISNINKNRPVRLRGAVGSGLAAFGVVVLAA